MCASVQSKAELRRGIVLAAYHRVADHLDKRITRGERVVTLAELSEATALDPGTAESVMNELVGDRDGECRRVRSGETRWYLNR